MDFLKLIWAIVCEFFNIRTEAAQDAWDERDWLRLALDILLMAFAIILGVGTPLFLVYRFRRTIIAVLAPVFMLAVLIASFFENGKPSKVSSTPLAQEDAVVMKHAKEGRNALLDYISVVCESLAEQTEIYSPGARDELAYPSLNKCIHIEKGVPVVSVQLRYEGEIDPAQFKERFNDRMAQKLDGGELLSKPPSLFYDKDNIPHTAIQAIRCVPFKRKKYIRLDVVRVNEAALALMDEVERENQSEVVVEEQLDDGEL